MHFFLHLTTKCNLNCKYCEGASDKVLEFGKREWNLSYPPSEISYSINKLKKFIEKDNNPWLIFYGGEPLLKIELIQKIMKTINAKFILQTNGLHLKKLGEAIHKLDTILISIDGKKETTDYFRGKNVYNKIIENVKWLKEKKFEGELIARMTVMEPKNIKEEVIHLLNLNLFDSVHWQLNAMFWEDLKFRKFNEWSKQYNQNIRELIDLWITEMKKGIVWKIYPFIGITKSLLENRKSKLRCGAGLSQYAILTDGNISPCVAMAGMKNFYVGNLDSNPNNLKKIEVGEPCTTCNIFEQCGGRCLFANKTKLWGDEGYPQVKKTVQNLISSLQNKLPEIKELIKNKKIDENDFNFHEFNSCEIIP